MSANALTAPVKLSPALSKLFGCAAELPRPEVTSRLWAYIKEHKLQGEQKSIITPNAGLAEVCGRARGSWHLLQVPAIVNWATASVAHAPRSWTASSSARLHIWNGQCV